MQTVKLGSRGNDVKTLQQILKITPADGIYGNGTFQKVKEFQKQYNLVQDGIVGPATWRILVSLTNDMYIKAAYKIGCEVAALKAVKIVETGGKAAFIATGKPSILFEGHVFWRELQARGIDPSKYAASNSTILYKTWTKKFYKSGLAEYTRLEQARRINVDAANASASWGMFQIMGNNYKMCGCKSVAEFVSRMCKSEEEQLMLTVDFINANKNIKNALINKQWALFARYYNGAGYKQNAYDTKLQQAYNKLK